MNEDICSAEFCDNLRELGISSVIQSRHGNYMVPQTQQNGSQPIDDIFISADIQCSRSEFCGFGEGPGDHRYVFADLDCESVLGME